MARTNHVGDLAREYRDDARDTAQSVKDTMYTAAEELKRNAQARLDEAREMAGDYYQEGRDRAMQLERTVESQIRRQPLQSMLIACGIGFLAGAMLLRR
jgi:ElaB/YqjD/DUF883 family membrane-anchored ribosome-binding protein